ncbi:MAG: Glu-tRNA(Gln) amidotransferase subunit GatE [Methanomassiliicoccales archaeon]|jgi:glutamyl-tRNA(Gln) amidotransferase subunit E|nr:Glu-tRNA(Gln) amidotransferase subunit GatE [Methanomassiliicoccales archaeon]
MTAHQLTCGIEIHQQLDTKKLFCSCATELVEDPGVELHRRLRPTQSELGEVDRAALAQAERRMRFRYLAPRRVTCLVEADEEPPHDADAQAIEVTLTFSALLHAKVVDEVHFMRKIVIDGSNTTGFQRTALVAVDGALEVDGRRITIQSICLEEDAARKMEAKGQEVTYKLDRLGIPLIEVATGPDMHTPEEVKEVAARLGSLLRATKKVKRGLGTVREDLNISIPGGARVEVKGVQELRMLPEYVQREVDRQRSLLLVQERLRSKMVSPVRTDAVDLTAIMKDCRSKVIASALSKGGKVLGAPLPGFEGVMKSPDGHLRLGAEMAQRARMRAGVMGIFHSDELPGYGISPEEVAAMRGAMSIEGEGAFAICADEAGKAEAALRAAVERANMALEGVPEETRDPLPDGSTAYSRPLPGASRMYPETDVKPITITERRMEEVRSRLPELPEEKVDRFVTKYGIHEQQARQIVRDGYEDLFEEVAIKYDLAAVAARTLLSTLPEIQKEGADVAKLDDAPLLKAFAALHDGRFAKEALPLVLKRMSEGRTVDEAVSDLGLQRLDGEEAEAIVAEVVRERQAFVKEKGMGAVGPLMGPVMERLRGKVDGKMASELLKKEIAKVVQGSR